MKWILSAIVAIVIPVILWNTLFLDYINANGKLIPWLCAPLFALASTGILLGMGDAKDPVAQKGFINPFWGWFGLTLVVEIVIVATANT